MEIDDKVTIAEVQALLGEQLIANYALRRQLQSALARIAELEASLNKTMSNKGG